VDEARISVHCLKKRTGGHKLEGDPTVLKLTDSFFKDGTIFATSFIKQ